MSTTNEATLQSLPSVDDDDCIGSTSVDKIVLEVGDCLLLPWGKSMIKAILQGRMNRSHVILLILGLVGIDQMWQGALRKRIFICSNVVNQSIAVNRTMYTPLAEGWQSNNNSSEQRTPLTNTSNVLFSSSSSLNSATTSHSTTISSEAWNEMLDKFPRELGRPVYLPMVLRDGKILVAKRHLEQAEQAASKKRFKIFTAMIRHALQLAFTCRDLSSSSSRQTPNGNKSKMSCPSHLLRRSSLPVIMSLGDQSKCAGALFPRLGWCTMSDDSCSTFVLPTYSLYSQAPDTEPNKHSFHAMLERQYPWSSKRQQVVWRGSATGNVVDDWFSLPRAVLVNASIHHPDLLDAAFTHARQVETWHPNEVVKMKQFSRFADFISFNDFQKYRAVVDIDGNSWSERFGNLLCMNSVVVKVAPRNENYFYRDLTPWEHYIPVAMDMSDLEEALTFAVSNETEAQVKAIVHRANEWCRTRFYRERLAKDVVKILDSYVRHLGTSKTRWRQWEDLLHAYELNETLVEPDEYNLTHDSHSQRKYDTKRPT